MKKLGLILLTLVLVTSCSLSKGERGARQTIDGTWSLTTITYDQPGTFKTTLFNDASADCFKGSQWFFRSNNSTGTYSLSDSNCSTGVRNIRWSANEIGKKTGNYDFTMKFTDEKKRDLDKNTGYRMDLQYLDDNTMQLTQTVYVDSKPLKINLNFTRLTQ